MEEKKEIKIENNKESDITKFTEKAVDGESVLFITENSLFQISVKYNDDKGKISVERIDDDFAVVDKTKEITVTLKYPSQGDCDRIMSSGKTMGANNKEMDIRDVVQMEFLRLLVLVRKWNLKSALNNENIMKLQPKIVKSMIVAVRDIIGLDGIL